MSLTLHVLFSLAWWETHFGSFSEENLLKIEVCVSGGVPPSRNQAQLRPT